MKFSIAIIAKNEEKTLPKLLESIKDVKDIVLVDTGSTDKTIEIAKSFGVKVFEKEFNIEITEELKKEIDKIIGESDIKIGDKVFNFQEARNWIAQKAENDLIFCPDCDEVLVWDLEAVENYLEQNPDQINYDYIFSSDAKDRPITEFFHTKFYNRKKMQWERNIHEIITSIKKPEKYKNKVEGWCSNIELSFLYNTAKDMETIVEIGSWKGRSTNALASGCKGKIYAVDHFLGSKGEEEQHKEAKDDIVYNQFLENTKQFSNIEVLRMSSEEAVKQFEDKSIDMIFIDAEHTYEGIKKDIEIWLPKAKKIICGHDYCDAWQGVKKGVQEKFGKLATADSIWIKDLDGEDRTPVKNITIPKETMLLKHYQNKTTNRSQYLIGLAIDYILNGYNDRNCHYLGRELYYYKKYELAIYFLALHATDENAWKTERGQSSIYIGDCWLALGSEEKAKAHYAIGFSMDTGRREGMLGLAQIFFDKKQWLEAERLYRFCLSIPKGNYYGNKASNYGDFVFNQLSVCLYYLGKKEESLLLLKKALELEPENEMYNNNLKFY
jgi:glycosyltransferase involved in cell wall biosynthesis